LTAVGYFAGAVTALLVLGRLSNHLGRKPVTFLALGLSAIACGIMLDVHSAAPLIIGRILQGLACGLASSAIASYIVDSAPAAPSWLAATAASGAPMVGLTVGSLGSGALIEYGVHPRTQPFLVVIGLLAICGLLVALGDETIRRNRGAWASLRPRIALTPNARKRFPVAAWTFVATWALGGFYQAFGPSMATDQLGSRNALVIAAVFASLMAPSVIGGTLAGRVSPSGAQRGGMLLFFLAVLGILLSLKAGAVVPFLAAGALAGAAQGATLTGSIRALLEGAQPHERAGLFSAIYATSYTGAALPSFIAGRLAGTFSLFQIAICYGILAGVSCVITLMTTRRSESADT
jgi:MFS family permease